MAKTARQLLAELVDSGGERTELDRAALLIAVEEYPELEVDAYLGKLDVLAERVSAKLHADAGPHETLTRMNHVLIEEEGYAGNENDYYDPRNSFLNDVIDRRTGIPITLSTLYLEVARRIGFSLEGIGFPGHFLVKHPLPGGEIIADPFHGGVILEEEDLKARLERAFRGNVRYEAELLSSISPRQILFRMLGNLKSIYLRERDVSRALSAVERMLMLQPDRHRERRDRGVLLAELDRPLEALRELARYRRHAPGAADDPDLTALMDQLKLKVGMAN